MFADDKSLYMSFNPRDSNDASFKLSKSINDIRVWMIRNKHKLMDSKTEYHVIGSASSMKHTENLKTFTIGYEQIQASYSARNIGAILDSSLSLTEHVNSIIQ